MLQAGFASSDITPPVGAILTGFIARPGPSTGVDLPLEARVLWLEANGGRAVLVALDLLGLGFASADRLTNEIAAACGCSPGEVVLTSTHTHAGPRTVFVRGVGDEDPAYVATLRERLIDAAKRARAAAHPATAAWTRANVCLGVNRRVVKNGAASMGVNPDGPFEPHANLLVLRGSAPNTRPIVVIEHACHPYCIAPSQLLISPDFCGYAVRELGEAGVDAMYLNGCAGDIAPKRGMQGQQAAAEEGHRLATATHEAVRALGGEPLAAGDDLRCTSAYVDLAHDHFPGLDAARKPVAQILASVTGSTESTPDLIRRFNEAMTGWLRDLETALAGGDQLPPVRVRVSLIRIAGGALAVLPGEPFVRIGQEIAAKIGVPNIAVAGYGHAFFGYIPTPDAYPFGGYEVDDSPRFLGLWRVAPDSAARLVDTAVRLWIQTK